MKLLMSLRYAILTITMFIPGLINPQLSYAEEPKSVTDAPSCGGIDCLIAGYGKDVRSFLIQMPVEKVTVMSLWQAQSNYFKFPTPEITINTSSDALKQYFQSSNSVLADAGTAYNVLSTFDITNIKNCDSPLSLSDSCKKSAASAIDNINFNLFFGPLTYSDTQQQSALSFLKMSTLQNIPFELADISSLLQKPADGAAPKFSTVNANNEDLKNYLALVRLYAALQATVMSNMYQFYNERLPFGDNADPKIKAALAELNKRDPKNIPNDPNKISPLELENYMATHRITETNTDNSSSWFLRLTENSPAMLQRQLVILQTENLAETHRLRMSIDRLTATMSMMMMQNAYNMRMQVDMAAKKIKPQN